MQVQGGGPKEELLDYLPSKKCNQDHPQSIGSKTCGGRRKESVLGVGVEGARLPRVYPVKAARSR